MEFGKMRQRLEEPVQFWHDRQYEYRITSYYVIYILITN